MQEEKTLDKKDKPVTQAADQAFVGPEAESGSIKSMMGEDELKSVIEALIFASDKPLAIKQIKDIVGDVDTRLIRNLVNGLKQEFTAGGRSFNICEVAGGFQFMTGPAYGRWLKKLYKIKMSDYLTGPSLETIAIIAYRQPVTKADIEFIRGVAVDGVINSLQQKGLIKVAGKKDVVGKPYLYGTTALFLQYFGLNSIDELPALSDFKVSDLEFNKPQVSDNITAQDETDTGDKNNAKAKDIEG